MKKIYIEISDICGLKCDFCPAPKGVRGVMDLATFKKAAFDARRFTRLIALHILGDPLKIENLSEYLAIAKEANLSVEITTSGANLSDFDLLLNAPIKQVNFSLDALKSLKNAPFLMRRICDFCAYKVQKKSEIFINLRIQKRAENREIIEFLAQNLGNSQNIQGGWLLRNARKSFGLPRRFCESARNDIFLNSSLRKCSAQNDNFGVRVAESALDSANLQNLAQNRIKLGNKIIIDFRDVFKWQVDSADFPSDSALSTQEANSAIADEFLGFCETSDEDRTLVHRGSELKRALRKQLAHTCKSLKSRCESKFAKGTCLALKTHLGILSDGTIVPCCIDISGNLALGNIKEISLDSALKSTRAQKMLQGFRENRLLEPFCQRCDYKNRFT